MIVYRLATSQFAEDLSGEGARIFGGRWNPVGLAALYLSEFISLSILEILVRANKFTSPDSYTLLHIQIPDGAVSSIENTKLKPGWQEHLEYTRWIGEQFILNNTGLILKVPSAIVPQEHNFLINPLHKDFKNVKLVKKELLELDKRLLQKI